MIESESGGLTIPRGVLFIWGDVYGTKLLDGLKIRIVIALIRNNLALLLKDFPGKMKSY